MKILCAVLIVVPHDLGMNNEIVMSSYCQQKLERTSEVALPPSTTISRLEALNIHKQSGTSALLRLLNARTSFKSKHHLFFSHSLACTKKQLTRLNQKKLPLDFSFYIQHKNTNYKQPA